ncbi:MAG: hypothetical protein CM15mV110_130 [Caudoviricetes sp.]|nr:MAG: hypothetical protein CM15mV110_130 [Caudoviricetes sp.]
MLPYIGLRWQKEKMKHKKTGAFGKNRGATKEKDFEVFREWGKFLICSSLSNTMEHIFWRCSRIEVRGFIT